MNKKIITILLSLLIITGCGKNTNVSSNSSKDNKKESNKTIENNSSLVCKSIIDDDKEYSIEYSFDFNSDDTLKSVEVAYIIYGKNPQFRFYEEICDDEDFVSDTCSFKNISDDKYELKAKRNLKSSDEVILGDLRIDGDETKSSVKEYMEGGTFNNYPFKCK